MIELLGYTRYIIDIYVYIFILGSVILSWLMGFGIVNPYNPTVRSIHKALLAFTEPLQRPIRRVLPDTGAIDLAPFALALICFFVRDVVIPNIAKLV